MIYRPPFFSNCSAFHPMMHHLKYTARSKLTIWESFVHYQYTYTQISPCWKKHQVFVSY